MTESMKPCGNMFHFFRAEKNRLEKELSNGTIERIFYTDKQNSIQYTISNGTEGTGNLTVLFSKEENTFWWRTETDRNKNGLGKCIGTITVRTDSGYTELCFIREAEMDTVPPIVARLVNDYHTKRSQMPMKLKEADSYCIENHEPEEN